MARKQFNEDREKLGANFPKEGAVVAEVFEVARADCDISLFGNCGFVKLISFVRNVLTVCIHENGVVVIVGLGVFDAGLDGPGVTHIEDVGDALDVGFGDDLSGGISGAIIDD